MNYFHVEDAGAAVVQIDWRNMYLEEIKLPHRIKTFGGGAHREVFFIGSGLLDQQKINSTIDRNVQKVCEQNLD